MNSSLTKELYKATALTFEELSFMLPMPLADDAAPDAECDIFASVAFGGPYRGRLMVGVPREFLAPLAANMLGEDDDVSELQQLDALAEVANVVCGNLLPAIAGGQAVFHFEAPQVFEGVLLADGEEPTAEIRIDLDEGWAKALLFVTTTN